MPSGSTIFVLILTIGSAALVVWAEIYSRRHHKGTDSTSASPQELPPNEQREETKITRTRRSEKQKQSSERRR